MATKTVSEQEMVALGMDIASKLGAGDVVFLQGNLGAGKTTLARSILHALGVHSHIKSPTYTIVEPYEVEQLQIYHFDLYRINSPLELVEMGIQDYFSQDAIILIEWPEKASLQLPPPKLICAIDIAEPHRMIQLTWRNAQSV